MRGGLDKRGDRKSTFKMEKSALIHSKTITDKANRWIISGKNASNRCEIGVLLRQNWKYSNSGVKTSWSIFLLMTINKRRVLISSGSRKNFEKLISVPPPSITYPRVVLYLTLHKLCPFYLRTMVCLFYVLVSYKFVAVILYVLSMSGFI